MKKAGWRMVSDRRKPPVALRNAIIIAVLLVAAVVVSVVIAAFFHKNKPAPWDVSSLSESSSAVGSSEIASVSSQLPSGSAAPKVSNAVRSNATSKAPDKVSKSQPVAQSGTVYDIYAAAPNWSYTDILKPVPLQPAVSNSYFNDAMFVGDSITTGLDLYSNINCPVVAYTGINTNTVLTRQVIKTASGKVTFLQAMKQYNPKKIYIMMGINGIAFQTMSSLISGYSQFIDKIKVQHPGAIIYVQSILPVTYKKQSKEHVFANTKINIYNAAIAQMAAKKGAYYLNVAEAFKDAYGNLPADASSDGIHFGPAYYRRWIEYLKRHTVYTAEPVAVSSRAPASVSSAASVSSQSADNTDSRTIIIQR